ncbi:DNA polymerase IV [Marinobacter nauticus]|uniref:DNA polymerase IV n=1 Tax=Marinobacter nauticus TaxID=2743 RepID=UPI001C997221|nr:DNA polymerase IV [Marinobacter nauticus]MBY5938457.1 DNA polymerase IV [Marinobacter nauticus]MBY5955686.1 DNA polymerase IV [Marinobacter nauticus]MBY6009477.1 DNA polymerase IV [Marinobacter nauticus]
MAQRKIIHVDCDCFYAAVEMRDDPSLRDVPLAVGGEGGRGVVTTCNYRARAFGVRSAMPGSEARRLCPGLVTVPTDMGRYRAVSQQVMAILREMTDLVEPLSLDEAFLDVTDVDAFKGSATLMARHLRERVSREVGITISAGVAPNKFLAKIASDWRKPDGLFVITPLEVADFVRELPVEKLFGVGQVTAARLHALGVKTCGDMQALGADVLIEKFGKQGYRLFEMAHGRDNRPVVVSRVAKSVSVERTFSQDLPDRSACDTVMPALVADLNLRLSRKGQHKPIHKLFVKIRYSDFSTHTLERVRESVTEPALMDFQPLLEELMPKDRPVRLLGVGVRFRNDDAPVTQLRLFD